MALGKKVKVMVVDDSLFFRNALVRALANDPEIEVIGSAGSAIEAEKRLETLKPDVMTLDVEMPGKRGTDFIKELIPRKPIPVVLVSSLKMSVFEALQCGAIDFVKKPDISPVGGGFDAFAADLSIKVKIASTAKVRQKPAAPVAKNVPLPAITNISDKVVIAIGASTGGTEATLEVIKNLPSNTPPMVITQHMPPGFTKMYAERLNRICKVRVVEGENGMRVERGLAIIAPGDKHMTLVSDVRGYYVKCVEGEKVSGHCPSVDVLFDSVAKAAGRNAIGVILTGMGRDGAAGMLNMHRTGAYNIGQNADSCVVYGMPMVAKQLGGVNQEAPLQDIGGMIVRRINAM